MVLWAFAGAVLSIAAAAADAPSIDPPTAARVVLRAAADGVQIYSCDPDGAAFHWVLKGPEASLFDETGRQIGKHFAGPSWQSSDGSLVTGEVAAKVASPNANAIPWLLLRAKSHEGTGQLASVKYIQRTDTKGGVAPSGGCDAAHQGPEARMRYSASYTFFSEGS
jgi:hypothetical protein